MKDNSRLSSMSCDYVKFLLGTVKVSNFGPRKIVVHFLARSVASLSVLCIVLKMNRTGCRSEVFLKLLFSLFFCRTRFRFHIRFMFLVSTHMPSRVRLTTQTKNWRKQSIASTWKKNAVQNLTVSNPGLKVVSSNAPPGWRVPFFGNESGMIATPFWKKVQRLQDVQISKETLKVCSGYYEA